MKEARQKYSGCDSILCVTVAILVLIGIVMVFSSSAAYTEQNDSFYFLKRQVLWCLLGTGLLLITKNLDYHNLHQHTYPIMIFTFLLLIVVMFPEFSKKVGGARRWLAFGGFSFQPSELAKFTLVLFIAKSLVKRADKLRNFAYGYLPNLIVLGFFFIPILFKPDFGNGYFSGHLHNAFCRRAQEKISVSFNSSNNSHCSISNFICRIPNQKNHRLSQSMGRSFWSRFSGRSVFLRFWKGRFLGRWFGRKFSETLSSSRSTHGFYFFSDWGRAGLCGNHSNRSLILNFYLERIFDGLPSQRSFWNSFSNRVDPPNWVAGFYKLGRRFRPSPYKGVDLTFYKHGRIVDACDNAFCRRNTEYFRANCKTLIMN